MRERLVRVLFIAVCVGLVLYGWSVWSGALPQYKNEALIKVTIILYIITLPSSFLVGMIYAGVALIMPIQQLDAGTAFLSWMIQTWGPLTVVGYVQWFVLLPWLWQKWKARRTGENAGPANGWPR